MRERKHDISAFYSLLDELAARTGGPRQLGTCSGRKDWPARGVYFFFEPGEMFADRARVVRIGTHALTLSSRTTLWKRLSQHRGTLSTVGGNHRGSIFRLLVGEALLRRDGHVALSSWGATRPADPQARTAEKQHETRVSEYIGKTSVLVLPVPDLPSPNSARGTIERNAIALLSNHCTASGVEPSPNWLGHFSGRDKVRRSGLWNNRHVDEVHDHVFLDVFARLVERII